MQVFVPYSDIFRVVKEMSFDGGWGNMNYVIEFKSL